MDRTEQGTDHGPPTNKDIRTKTYERTHTNADIPGIGHDSAQTMDHERPKTYERRHTNADILRPGHDRAQTMDHQRPNIRTKTHKHRHTTDRT